MTDLNETIFGLSNNNYTDVFNNDYFDNNNNNCSRDIRSDRPNNFNNTEKNNSDDELPSVIYRFKFTEEFMEQLYNFSKIHQYDSRLDFKDAWKDWTEENKEIIAIETSRLKTLGFEGDILTKMYKSSRYYFKNKPTVKQEPIKRRTYVSVSKELLEAIDNHITENIYNNDYQPKTGLYKFCKKIRNSSWSG